MKRSRPPGHLTAAFLLVLLTLLLATQPSAWALSSHERGSFMAGVAIGFSPGQVALFPGEGDAVTSDWKVGVTPQYRFGYALLDNRLLLSVANQQWLYEQGILAEDKLRINVQNWNFALNYYPANPQSIAGGIYFTAGAGFANARLTLLEPIEDDPHGNKFEEILKQDEGGWSYQVGAGFEFRILPKVAVGLSVSYVYQSFEGEIFQDAWSLPTNFTLQWYW